jgi:hypothetical protein
LPLPGQEYCGRPACQRWADLEGKNMVIVKLPREVIECYLAMNEEDVNVAPNVIRVVGGMLQEQLDAYVARVERLVEEAEKGPLCDLCHGTGGKWFRCPGGAEGCPDRYEDCPDCDGTGHVAPARRGDSQNDGHDG